MKVISFNVWSDASRSASWQRRRDRMAELLLRPDGDLLGLQEPSLGMIRDLQERLPEYSWVGHGRDDGGELGEFTPIFFRKDRFQVIESASFWLSAACDVPGRGWDAYCSRTVTWARFEDLQQEREFVCFNTHLDHLGRRARVQSALLILSKIQELGGADPVVVTGDFNCGESSAPYRTLTGKVPFAPSTEGSGILRDTFFESERPAEGPRKTYRGWMSFFGIGRIDHIFVKNGFRAIRHVTMDDDRPPVSDHRPVMAELAYADAIS